MNVIAKTWLGTLCLLAAQGAWASVQDADGLACSAGAFSVTAGPAFSALCEGDLRIDVGRVIVADESITLTAGGNLWMAGTLVAPNIVLVAQATLSFTGGVFSGSPAYFPEVQARQFAGSPAESVRWFSDLVPRPVIDPVYGAIIARHVDASHLLLDPIMIIDPVATATYAPIEYLVPILDLTFSLEPAVSTIPEPALPALFAAGLGLIAWKRRSGRTLSHAAHRV